MPNSLVTLYSFFCVRPLSLLFVFMLSPVRHSTSEVCMCMLDMHLHYLCCNTKSDITLKEEVGMCVRLCIQCDLMWDVARDHNPKFTMSLTT